MSYRGGNTTQPAALSRLNRAAAAPAPSPSASAPSPSSLRQRARTYAATTAESQSTAQRNQSIDWELDFCSRPIFDERGKKVWELLVTDSTRSFVHAEYFPNNKINSRTLREALQKVMEEHGRPDRVRFFRQQMQTIISRALGELKVQALPSWRCISLMGLLDERLDEVYSQHPGYKAGTAPVVSLLDKPPPAELPDALRGEQWAFVQLPLSDLKAEGKLVTNGSVFGQMFDLEPGGVVGDAVTGDLPGPDALVPGVAVFSRRAMPLAAWTNGLEMGMIEVDRDRSCLILETGVGKRWRYASYRASEQADAEGAAWEAAKQQSGGLHFLAVQGSPDDEPTGLWLLWDREPPAV